MSVYDTGTADGKQYLAMEFVSGLPMSKWRLAGRADTRRQVAILRDVALAVHHAHQHGVIHRDLKPENILVDAKDQPHVMDFGLAKPASKEVAQSLTTTGVVMGTPRYMSPEQARGLRTVDHRTDIYALGVMVYESLTGLPPFAGETPLDVLVQTMRDEVTPPSRRIRREENPELDEAIERICMKALAKKPEDRQPSAEAFAADLTGWLNARPAPVPAPPSSRKVPIAIAAVVLAAGALLVAKPWDRPAPLRTPASAELRPALAEAHALSEHKDRVWALAFSPDGRTLASASWDRTARLWEAATGKRLHVLTGHTSGVTSVAWSPDGGRLATGSYDQTVKIWEVAGGREVLAIDAHGDGTNCLAWSPAGDRIASGSRDKSIRIWDASSGKIQLDLAGHAEEVLWLAFRPPDGAMLASCGADRTVRLWETRTGQPLGLLAGHQEQVRPVAFRFDGKRLASASVDKTIRLWDPVARAPAGELAGSVSPFESLAWSPDGRMLAAGCWDSTVKLWDAADGKLLLTIPAHTQGVPSLAWSPDGRLLASGSTDSTLKIWTVSSK